MGVAIGLHRSHLIGTLNGDVEDRVATHRKTDEMDARESQVIENGNRIGHRQVLGIGVRVVGNVGGRKAASVESVRPRVLSGKGG